ncbi:MAG: hypothetical protein ABW007_27250 [Chitinophagaceae bacterium]
MAGIRAALSRVEDVIVSIKCPKPKCGAKFPSPGYPDSAGWDKKDMKLYGKSKPVECPKCGEKVKLPAKLFEFAG